MTGVMWRFLRDSVNVVTKRALLLVSLNWLFFGGLLAGALAAEAGFARFFVLPVGAEVFSSEVSNVVLLLISIFLFNLILSGFALLTLTGLGLFVLPVGFLILRAFLWGMLLDGLSTPVFLAALPTVVLEGEGYALAALAGIVLGLSWFKPKWAYPKEGLSRLEAIRRSLRDCARTYALVSIVLLLGATVETLTLILVF